MSLELMSHIIVEYPEEKIKHLVDASGYYEPLGHQNHMNEHQDFPTVLCVIMGLPRADLRGDAALHCISHRAME